MKEKLERKFLRFNEEEGLWVEKINESFTNINLEENYVGFHDEQEFMQRKSVRVSQKRNLEEYYDLNSLIKARLSVMPRNSP